jgi:hypothetical protein
VQKYTPGALLQVGQVEIKVFNNLYTQTRFFDDKSQLTPAGGRQTYFSIIFEGLYGLSNQLNIGIDAFFRSVHVGPSTISPLEVFKFQVNERARTALTRIGPKIKFAPLTKVPELSMQSTVFFPLAPDLQGVNRPQPYLDYDGYVWWNRVFYDKSISSQWQLFAEGDLFGYVDRHFEKNNSAVRTPLKLFLTYFPLPTVSVYGMSEWNPAYGLETMITSHYLQSGIGGKYQLTSALELELLYTNFWWGRQAGAGQTFNIGLRYLN